MPLPDELTSLLGGAASVTHHVALRSGLGSVLGESHLVLGGRLRVFGKDSLFAPMVELADVSSARLERSSLRQELVLVHRDGTTTIEVDYGETKAVVALLAALDSAAATDAQTTHEAPSGQRPGNDVDTSDDALRVARARLLGWLASNPPLRRSRSTLVALFEKRRRKLAPLAPSNRVLESRTFASGPSPHDAPPRAVHRPTSTADPGTSILPWLVLVALVLAGLTGAALVGVLASK